MSNVTFTINGEAKTITVPPIKHFREDLHLTGTKESCGEGESGPCSVLMNGDKVSAADNGADPGSPRQKFVPLHRLQTYLQRGRLLRK